jgi:hypothetical protein
MTGFPWRDRATPARDKPRFINRSPKRGEFADIGRARAVNQSRSIGRTTDQSHTTIGETKNMIKKHLTQVLTVTGLATIMMVGAARADTLVSYTTNLSGTEFVGGVNSLILHSDAGQTATLTFVANTTSNSGVPSNIDLGDFILTCSTCSTSQTTLFGSFTFDLVVDDTTDGATGEFIGTSSGGTVSSNSSTVQINWTAPPGLKIGPGTTEALTGSFGTTSFDLVSPTSLIVAPNSGTPAGDTTIQGQIGGNAPEPATFAMIGGGLLGLGLVKRKKLLRS